MNKMRLGGLTARLALLLLLTGGGTLLADPFITGLDPAVGSTGDQVMISGNGFAPSGNGTDAVVIKFNGVTDTSPLSGATSDTSITAHVPSGATSGLVVVYVNGKPSNGVQFTVIGPGIYLSGFSPSYGAINDLVVITGYHFTAVAPDGVKFGSASSVDANPNGNGTQISVHVPTGATTAPISVTASGVTSNTATAFTVIGPGPFVSGFSPQIGNIGSPVQISGRFFTGATAVKFNGTNVPGFSGPASDTQINVNVPPGASSGPISVTTPSGTFITSSNFYVPAVISNFSPASGGAGTSVTINGTNFTGTSSVTFNGTAAAFGVNAAGTQITTTVPDNATSGFIVITTPAGLVQSARFVVLPAITGFSQASGPVGTQVTIFGHDFTGATAVRFNGTSATFNNVTFTQLTATVPSGATTGPISVTIPDGTGTSAGIFYLPAIIISFSPNMGNPLASVNIAGVNFTGVSQVFFNGVSALFQFNSDTSITAFIPINVTSGPLSVLTPAGVASSTNNFYAPPAITGFSPSHGLPSTSVTITGSNFLDASAVKFNNLGVPANGWSVLNNNTIHATVPVGAQTGPITVVAPAGSVTTATNFVLDYTADLYPLTSVAQSVTVGSNLVYTFTIFNAGPNDAPNVRVTNTLPASVLLKRAFATQGTLTTNSNPIFGNLGTISAFNFAAFTLTVVPQSVGMITNVVTVASDLTDPVPGNNTNVAITKVLPLPLLFIKTVPPKQVSLTWSNDLGDFSLQYKDIILTNYAWLNSTNARQTNGSAISVLDSDTNSARFYRLSK